MTEATIIGLIVSILEFGTLLYLAALGETIAERAGVLNLGVEGMMAVGAMVSFWIGTETGNPWLALLAALIAVGVFAMIHGIAAVVMGADQVVSGLALTILGLGLAAFFGQSLQLTQRISGAGFDSVNLGPLTEIPWVGPTIFSMDAMSWLALIIGASTWFVLSRTRAGLSLRAVGESAATADAAGTKVVATRLVAVATGGAFAGMAGSYLSLVVAPGWSEGATGGLGWIAVALVIFGAWKPGRVLFGSLLFGGLIALGPRLQTFRCRDGEDVPCLNFEADPILVSMLPYLLTVVVLIVLSVRSRNRPSVAPAAIGIPYRREER